MNSRPEVAAATQPSRHRIAALLIAAVPAATALSMTAVPLTVATGAAAKPHPRAALVADGCTATLHAGAFGTMKYPQCAGD